MDIFSDSRIKMDYHVWEPAAQWDKSYLYNEELAASDNASLLSFMTNAYDFASKPNTTCIVGYENTNPSDLYHLLFIGHTITGVGCSIGVALVNKENGVSTIQQTILNLDVPIGGVDCTSMCIHPTLNILYVSTYSPPIPHNAAIHVISFNPTNGSMTSIQKWGSYSDTPQITSHTIGKITSMATYQANSDNVDGLFLKIVTPSIHDIAGIYINPDNGRLEAGQFRFMGYDDYTQGPRNLGNVNTPHSICVSPEGIVYVSETGTGRIQSYFVDHNFATTPIDAYGVSNVAGNFTDITRATWKRDIVQSAGYFYGPSKMVIIDDLLYVCDEGMPVIQVIQTNAGYMTAGWLFHGFINNNEGINSITAIRKRLYYVQADRVNSV